MPRVDLRAQERTPFQVLHERVQTPMAFDARVKQPTLERLEDPQRYENQRRQHECGHDLAKLFTGSARAAEHVVGQQGVDADDHEAFAGRRERLVGKGRHELHQDIQQDENVRQQQPRAGFSDQRAIGRCGLTPKVAQRQRQQQQQRQEAQMIHLKQLVDEAKGWHLLAQGRQREKQEHVQGHRIRIAARGVQNEGRGHQQEQPIIWRQECRSAEGEPEVAAQGKVLRRHEAQKDGLRHDEGQRRKRENDDECFEQVKHTCDPMVVLDAVLGALD